MNLILGAPITIDEALDAMDEGGTIITSGGYTFVSTIECGRIHYYYCAFGTWPGCLRGGPPVLRKDLEGREWYRLTTEDVIRKKGYYPEVFPPRVIERCVEQEEDLGRRIDWWAMLTYCIDSPYTEKEFKDPATSSKIWAEYFDNLKKSPL